MRQLLFFLLQWNTHVFRVEFSAVAPVFATLLPSIPEPQRSPAAYALLEKFKMYAQTKECMYHYFMHSSFLLYSFMLLLLGVA